MRQQGPTKEKDFRSLAGTLMASETYVQVNTENNPEGELRGQLGITAEQRDLMYTLY